MDTEKSRLASEGVRPQLHAWLFRIAVLVSLGAGAVIAQAAWRNLRHAPPVASGPIHMVPLPGKPDNIRSGSELIAVYLVSSHCAASKDSRFPPAVARINNSLAAITAAKGMTFTRRGVALDGQPADGLRFLTRVGTFDEFDVGRNWLNSQAIQYVWRDFKGPSSLPQIILLERHADVSRSKISVSPERVLLRKVGTSQIEAWANAGAPLELTP